MRSGDIIAGMVLLIAMFLLLNNWEGAYKILATVFSGTTTLTKTLQGR